MAGDVTESRERLEALTSWHHDWSGLRVAVFGLGVTGFSVADTPAELRMAFKVLKDAGYAPAEVQMLHEVATLCAELAKLRKP